MTFLSYAGIFLQVVLLVLLLRGPFRTYPILFIYCIAQLGWSGVLAWILRSGAKGAVYRTAYWWHEVTVDLCLFLVVITMTYLASRDSPLRSKIGRMLGSVVAIVMILPFLLFYRRPLFSTAWFNGTSQLLNFGVAIMTMILWAVLIGRRQKDWRLLVISAGLGIAVTGSALSYGFRQFTASQTPRDVANLVGQVAYVIAVMIWCRAFWPKSEKSGPPAPAIPTKTAVS